MKLEAVRRADRELRTELEIVERLDLPPVKRIEPVEVRERRARVPEILETRPEASRPAPIRVRRGIETPVETTRRARGRVSARSEKLPEEPVQPPEEILVEEVLPEEVLEVVEERLSETPADR